MPNEAKNYLCNIRKDGEQEFTKFVKNRLSEHPSTEFNKPLKEPVVSTIVKLNKHLTSKRSQSVNSINIDRQIFSQFCVIA